MPRWAFVLLVALVIAVNHLGKPVKVKAAGNNVTVHFQWGNPRSVSTLQFSTVCAGIAATLINKPDVSLHCGFGHVQTTLENLPASGEHYVVLKQHTLVEEEGVLDFLLDYFADREPPFVWQTTKHDSPRPVYEAKKAGMKITELLTLDRETVVRYGYVADKDEYSKLLGLTQHEESILYEWLELWDILRVCCGMQMSKGWRAALQSDSPSHHRCSMYNIDVVEKSLMHSKLYESMIGRVPTLGQVSQVDGPLTGSYCSECSKNIRLKGLGFNNKCVESDVAPART